ncbi:MAG TPA: pyridoxamine 5'-phosphate oxidase family protein [Candidatus Thermoplasmatota archaeon]|nr:pyridoxamine 5'-phosphate oxidase family protein [Candidatus Thermoplasmatota archaeon]
MQPQTKVRRLPQRGTYDRAAIDAILDEALVCHVGFVDGGLPVVIPTGFVRDGDRLLLHGSRASRMMRHLASGAPVCVTVTLLDGLVLARSAFHHSMNYRSVVVHGQARPVPDREANAALLAYMERLLPGRWDAVRQPDAKELAGTLVVGLPLAAASAKVRAGPPGDEPEDLGFPAWAGVLPLRTVVGPAEQDPQQAPAPVPPHVSGWRLGPR